MIKKISFALLVIVIAFFIRAFFVLPTGSLTNQEIIIATTEGHVFDFLTNKGKWPMWWPGTINSTGQEYCFNSSRFAIKKISNSEVYLATYTNSSQINTRISFIAADKSRVKVRWQGETALSYNPIKRVMQIRDIDVTERQITAILKHLKEFLENDKNVYHIDVKLTRVKDSVVLAKQIIMNEYPGADKIYPMINILKKQIKQHGAVVIDSPMLNINQTGKNSFAVMVGIPINKEIVAGNGSYINKMVLGNILIASVNGGPNTVRNAVKQLANYRRDYGLISPAMPFESLATNRITQKDTSKWVTNLYYPIY
ncbi:GyrI-like domain-containing protein [Mucilaginibacter sp.]|uniref:GyrI-like domain-containing protein n=1 Tax=Mucilaginibacter sp. TaxID=1882438 RepID=UPI002606CA9E|nr:GyrI-like domain-containing protein [Mucilaginibacter sp.]MDB5032721.1 hypothetical protein [Mucilaginibacter sp.]